MRGGRRFSPWSTRDRDGVLSEQEFADAGRQDFGSADGNGDGKVTIWEFYAATRL